MEQRGKEVVTNNAEFLREVGVKWRGMSDAAKAVCYNYSDILSSVFIKIFVTFTFSPTVRRTTRNTRNTNRKSRKLRTRDSLGYLVIYRFRMNDCNKVSVSLEDGRNGLPPFFYKH